MREAWERYQDFKILDRITSRGHQIANSDSTRRSERRGRGRWRRAEINSIRVVIIAVGRMRRL